MFAVHVGSIAVYILYIHIIKYMNCYIQNSQTSLRHVLQGESLHEHVLWAQVYSHVHTVLVLATTHNWL